MKAITLAVLLCAAGGISSVEIIVNHIEDGAGTEFGCNSAADQCNLRSAWLHCHASQDELCAIHLSPDSYHTINATIGQLELQKGLTIAILGNNSTITGIAPRREAVTENEDFPLNTGLLTETNSAFQDVASGCVEACPLDMLRFSACDGDADTYFRLYDDFGLEVKWDDDGCGRLSGPSTITYIIPENSLCQQYCLHVGCYENVHCSANVTIQLDKPAPAAAGLISYRAENNTTAAKTPASGLALYGLVFQGFGAPYGGVVHCSGDLDLTVENCEFRGSGAFYGGAIYIANNSRVVYVTGSVFNSTTAAVSGGAIYIERDVAQLTVSNCAFYNCSAHGSGDDYGGGAVYLGDGSHGAVIRGVTVQNCSAPAGSGGGILATGSERLLVEDVAVAGCSAGVGGGIAFHTGCDDAVLHNVQVNQSSAWSVGGAISLWEANQRVRLIWIAIDQCDAESSGGGLYVHSQNAFLSLFDVNVTRCSARTTDGGGIRLYQANLNVTMEAVVVQQCSAAVGGGGGISLSSSNAHLAMRSVDITDCTADRGGGIYLYLANTHLTMRVVTIAGCTASFGGGIYLYQGNSYVEVNGATIGNCSATSSGGGIYVNTANVHLTVRDADIAGCSAGDGGGGIYLYSANEHTQLTAVRIDQCSAEHVGGGLRAYQQNHYLSLAHVTITQCSVRDGGGGGIHLNRANLNVTIEVVVIQQCSAHSYGGGIFVNTANDHLTVRDADIAGCSAGYDGGGVYLDSANEHTLLTTVRIDRCSAERVGGGLSAYQQNHYLSLVNVTITRCSVRGGDGGGIDLDQANLNVVLQHVRIMDCNASNIGGGMAIGNENNFFVLGNVTLVRCKAGGGGGLTIYGENSRALVDVLLVEDCSATRSGGGMLIVRHNHFLLLRNMRIVRCEASSGGGLALSVNNVNVTIEAVVVADCKAAEYGGGINVVSGNDYLVLRGVRVSACDATYGGGVTIDVANKHVQLVGAEIDRCSASGWSGTGGGMFATSQNDHLTLSGVHITGCGSDFQGGGFYSLRNDGLTIMDSRIEHCSADGAGGGLLLFNAHADVVIVNSTISNNTAWGAGGGVASMSATRDLVIAGCVLTYNEARGESGQGGGIYLDSGHSGFALLSEASYRTRVVIETEHPYEYSQQLLVNRTVAVPGATGYYVYFDPLSKLSAYDDCKLTAAGSFANFHAESFNWPGIDGPPRHWLQNRLTVTCATASYPRPAALSDDYYGIKLYAVPVFDDVEGTTVVVGNTAEDKGGGLYIGSRELFPILIGAQFRNNEAGSDGGGMYLRNEVIGMVAHQLVMEGNRAQDGYGGGMCASTGCYAMQAQNCTFTNNSAGDAGGALAFVSVGGTYGDLLYGNDNTVAGSSFSHNTASVGGGAVYLGTFSALTMLNSTLTGNTAHGDGGAVLLGKRSRLTANHLTVSQNRAGDCGGGMALEDTCTVAVSNSSLSANVALAKGGAFCAKVGSLLDITETEVILNVASRVGGALYCSGSLFPVMRQIAISENIARWGSALYLDGVKPPINSTARGVTMTDNQAAVGTIYWVNGTMLEPAEFTASLAFADNTVLFGQEVATQAVELRVPESIIVDQYRVFLNPPTELTLLDWYGELSPASASAFVEVSIMEVSKLHCSGRPPFLSGADVSAGGVAWQDGVAVFGLMGVTCYPGSNVTLQFTAHLADQVDLSAEQQTVSAITNIYFRSCRVGEFINNDECAVCPSGSYSLDEVVSDATRCTECLSKDGVESCYGADIVLTQGYWRRHAYSEAVLRCLEDVDGCAGGNAAGDASCRQGYEGPLCSVCADGYYLSDARCQPCTDSDRLAPASMLYVALAAAVLTAVLAVLFYKSSRMYSGDTSSVWESLYNVVSWLIDELRSLQSQIKILITTFQICTTVHVSMKVTFPVQFMRYLNAMSVVNLNVVALVPLSCLQSSRYTFIDKLVMVTLGPIALSLLIALIGAVEYQRCAYRSRGDHNVKEALNKVTSRYLTMFLFLTYLVLPYVATTIFQTFLCTNVDPQNSDTDTSDLYLTADMRISCDSDYYRSGVGYAAVMAVLYVGGIPLMYALLLYRSRSEITGRFTTAPSTEGETAPLDTIAAAKADDEHSGVGLEANDVKCKDAVTEAVVNYLEKRADSAALEARMISFLYEAYEPKFWYWEVVETTRRLVLTAVLSVCGAGTGSQAILALLLAQLYIKLYGYCRPYLENMDDMEAEVGQYQIFLTFLGALICQRHLLGSEYDSAVSGVMVAINTSVTIMFTRNVLLKLREDVKNLRNLAQVFPKLAPLGGSYAVADAEEGSEHGLELSAFSGKDKTAGVVAAVGALADDAVRPFEDEDIHDYQCVVEVCASTQDRNNVLLSQRSEETV
jgi:hypothetical protein